jgi:Resolvase, N terminal domain
MVITDWYYDAAVSGADPIESRPGIVAALTRIAGNGVRTIVVETANRFARDLIVQEVGFAMLRDLGITLIAADSPASFLDDPGFLVPDAPALCRPEWAFYLNAIAGMTDADSLITALRNAKLFEAVISDSEIATRALRAADKSEFAGDL